MSVLVNLVPLCASEMTQLRNFFVLRRDTAGELGSPSYSSLSPPTIIRTLYVSLLSGCRSYMRFVCVTFASFDTLLRGMKNIVFVPFTYC